MLSSAVTASAAAFNPAMGSVSMQLGPAVTFLMCALGLRLGLWINRPEIHDPESFRRRTGLFFREMFGSSDPQQIHLSDGGHFENLGLYELVRRHCRYIIASDCGADPAVAFDDLANAIRRIREDFGVEIELDVRPLKPGTDGLARQHMAVGTIHYDQLNPKHSDKGILLYFKPNLTGDEPSDVRQYSTRNSEFPNETTVDQFYDEAQWESYRRLGEHAAKSALRFLETYRVGVLTRDEVFAQARREWYPTPPDFNVRFVEFSARFADLEEKLRTAPGIFVAEMYPELNMPPQPTLTPLGMRSVFSLLVEMIQFMEDLYIGCHFEETRGHPLNAGWMNLFARWTVGTTFRLWWPFLRAVYSPKFRAFLEREFTILTPHTLTISGPSATIPAGLAATWWLRLGRMLNPPNHQVYEYVLSYQPNPAQSPQNWQVAFAVVKGRNRQTLARWDDSDFFIPPSLWGSGIGTRFLAELCIS